MSDDDKNGTDENDSPEEEPEELSSEEEPNTREQNQSEKTPSVDPYSYGSVVRSLASLKSLAIADLDYAALTSVSRLASSLRESSYLPPSPYAYGGAAVADERAAAATLTDRTLRAMDWSSPASETEQQLRDEAASLRREITQKVKELEEAKGNAEENQRRITELEALVDDYEAKNRTQHILSRIHPQAKPSVLNGDLEFPKNESCDAFVLSIDIRRSTDLMLKARSPELFSSFIWRLCDVLRAAIIDALGVFDKFTGDGILSFFPSVYSGVDCGLYALQVADRCHRIFDELYREHRNCFNAVLRDTGLGIGIDYGQAHLLQFGSELTLVGVPVVYACRLSGGNAGETLVNQPAYEHLHQRYAQYCKFSETSIPFKNEGEFVAYKVSFSDVPPNPQEPDWMKESTNETDGD